MNAAEATFRSIATVALVVLLLGFTYIVAGRIAEASERAEHERTERATACAQVGGTWIAATEDCIAPRSAG